MLGKRFEGSMYDDIKRRVMIEPSTKNTKEVLYRQFEEHEGEGRLTHLVET